MGKERETTVVQSQGTQTTTPQLTPAEREIEELRLQGFKEVQPQQIQVEKTGLDLVNRLLAGETELPGFFGQIGRGISPEITSDIVSRSLQDIAPSFQKSGILDSGVAAEISGQIAGDIRRSTQEFNIGNKLNLLNLALSGQAQVQQPLNVRSQILSSQLAGLRPITQTSSGTSNQTTTGMNPFLSNFQQSFGQNLGATFGSPTFIPGFGG